jgi:DNA helicase HerA-like ATPase
LGGIADYEKLGAFYLGRRFDLARGEVTGEDLLYDARDLTTHAVIVGMTGSGKTGLGVALLEEAAIDGIPAIAIDPKGDLSNLLLGFPELRAEDFRPWIDAATAARSGRTQDEEAAATAERWRSGLADWGQDGARIARFAAAAERVVYTPGSRAGRPLSLLRQLEAPPAGSGDDEALRERAAAAVSGLLALVGVAADPLRSREHILLATLVERAFREGRGLDLPALIRQTQKPPVERVGVMELESFFPAGERFELAMALNNLLASPGFADFRAGDPLDIGSLLFAADGRPKLSIVSIAHLSEPERMFVVTLVLNELIAWMRRQPGSATLRALLYMDEVFGYFPPTANPPAKTPMLTLLKQARAYGLGVVLATQNPVDLDYKGLANAGTWFLGRLLTERDKARVIEGLEGASAASGAAFDRQQLEALLAGLPGRVFLMSNVHEDAPVVFQTRWVLSYLAGPLTREQIRRLAPAGGEAAAPAPAAAAAAAEPSRPNAKRPVLPAGIPERFVPIARAAGPGRVVYRPALLGRASLHYVDARAGIDAWEELALLSRLAGDGDPWQDALAAWRAAPDLDLEPEAGASFAELPTRAVRADAYPRFRSQLDAHLHRERPLVVWRCAKPAAVSRPGETEAEFRGRLRELLREQRDLEVEKLRARFAPKLAALAARIERAQQREEVEREQYQERRFQSAISIGASVVGALFGRKLASAGNVGRASSAARGIGRAARERGDIARAEERTGTLREELGALEAELAAGVAALGAAPGADALALDEVRIAPRKSDLGGEPVLLVWTPWSVSESGAAEPLFGA